MVGPLERMPVLGGAGEGLRGDGVDSIFPPDQVSALLAVLQNVEAYAAV
jgi:hypothetical protein